LNFLILKRVGIYRVIEPEKSLVMFSARLENDAFKVYNENSLLIGVIKAQSNSKRAEFIVDGDVLKRSQDQWDTILSIEGKVADHLNLSLCYGNTTILEMGCKINMLLD
jgi:hypothetical protein